MLADLIAVGGSASDLSQLDLRSPIGTVPHKGDVAPTPLLIDIPLVVCLSLLQRCTQSTLEHTNMHCICTLKHTLSSPPCSLTLPRDSDSVSEQSVSEQSGGQFARRVAEEESTRTCCVVGVDS